MGNIKIEFDVPDFESELEISVIIKKDGEVVSKTSTSSPSNATTKSVKKNVVEKNLEPKKSSSFGIGGNMMDLKNI